MGKEFDLLSYGEVLLRLSPEGHERLDDSETFTKRVGGAELNVATGVAMLGLRTGIISKLPSNPLGTFAKNRIRFSGVSDDYLVYDDSKEARLGLYYYEIGRYPRKPSVVYDRANTSFSHSNISDYPESMYASTKLFHVSGVTLALCEETRNTAIEMIHKFKDAGALISFDVNFRGNLWTGDEARECI
jgi:2-dehydro-3-deoxygluconokinase